MFFPIYDFKVKEWSEVMPVINNGKLVLAPWCEDPETEEEIKKESTRLQEIITEYSGFSSLTGAIKPLCIPMQQVKFKYKEYETV